MIGLEVFARGQRHFRAPFFDFWEFIGNEFAPAGAKIVVSHALHNTGANNFKSFVSNGGSGCAFLRVIAT
ncbi:MAG TPA: hypothetical protein V6D17_11590 [Candidatus Obscuribacterales bacterium]